MKITIVHSGREKGKILFRAEPAEGTDLKRVSMLVAKNATIAGIVAAIEDMATRGYTQVGARSTKTRQVFLLRKGAA